MQKKIRLSFILLFLITIVNTASAQKFAVLGCYGLDGSHEADVADLINSWNPDFIITLGDNNYPDGSSSTIDDNIGKHFHQYIYNYQGNYGAGSTTRRFFPAIGNHDWHSGIQAYIDYFDLPVNYNGSQDSSNTGGQERYYDFVWGNFHFFILDNYGVGLQNYTFPRYGNYGEPDEVDENSDQADWFFSRIDSCVQYHSHWRVVIAHQPPFSSGSHGSDPGVQWHYKEHGAHIVLSAHDHDYERLEISGLTYVVNGLGGKSIHGFGSLVQGSVVQYNSEYGAMLFELISDTQLRARFYDVNGVQHDDFTLEDSALPVELINFCGNFSEGEVNLNWETETEVNNYCFVVERYSTMLKFNWIIIGVVEGYGNSNSPTHYNFVDDEIDRSGTYYYRLKQIDNDGTFEYSEVISVAVEVPNKFYLSQNYPNPFNPATRIDYTLPEKQMVSLRVYNILGELVTELVNEEKPAGSYSVSFDASNLPSGVYIYRLQTPTFIRSRKMSILK